MCPGLMSNSIKAKKLGFAKDFSNAGDKNHSLKALKTCIPL